MANFRCWIEQEDSWRQVDSHWEYERWFELFWEVPKEYSLARFGYYFGKVDDTSLYIMVDPTTIKSGETITYKFTLFGSLEELKETGCLSISVFAEDEDHNTVVAIDTLNVDFPPEALDEARLKKFSSTKYKCMWPQAGDTGDNKPSIAGYSIELKERLKDSDEWAQVKGIKAELVNGKYWIVKDNKYHANKDNLEFSNELAENKLNTFLGPAGAANIANIEGIEYTEAFFNPNELGFEKDYYYKFVVYPYIVYSQYTDDGGMPQPSSYLAPKGTESNEVRHGGGTMRVKTADGWREGQVWVMTETGWKEATGVYTKTATGWKESI